MKKTSTRKLTISKQTLRALTGPEMARLAGGAATDLCTNYCSHTPTRCDCPTRTCETQNTACMWSENPCQV